MMGINIDRVIVFTFVLGSALAGAAGVLFAIRVPTQVSIGFLAGLKGFTAAVIGGIGSVPGAMVGGLILGFAESYSAGYTDKLHIGGLRIWPPEAGTRWTDLVIFSILIAFMVFRPQGLFGRRETLIAATLTTRSAFSRHLPGLERLLRLPSAPDEIGRAHV